MSFRKILAAVVVVVALLAVAVPAFAVKYGQPDNGAHPYVGLVVFYDQSGAPRWRCTGTMISDRVLLTAGHCTELNAGARVWFDEEVTAASGYPTSGGYAGTAYTFGQYYQGAFPNRGDVGVVVLNEAPNLGTAPLASVGYLDSLATQRGQQNVNFEVVGYGLQSVKPELSQFKTRLKATVQLVNLRSALTDGYNVQTTNNPGKGTGPGGTCFGDSGGAIFSDGQIVALNSFVLNENCAGAAFGYRVDLADVQTWIKGFTG